MPAGHDWQVVSEPAGFHVPAAHVVAAVVGSAGQLEPAGQGSQPLKSARDRVYAGQVVHVDWPPVEKVPVVQLVPPVDPAAHRWPTGHTVQLAEFALDEK